MEVREVQLKMRKLAAYLKPYWWMALLAPLSMIGEVLVDLFQPDHPTLAADGVGDKNHASLQSGNAHTFGGII